MAEGLDQDEAIGRVIESAARLGVEIDAGEAKLWIKSMAAEAAGGDIVVDVDTGVFGHRASMLDLAPQDLERFKRIAPIVGFENRPGVQTALALSGSSAQSRIHAYPADADFFERVHITADTREEACRILGDVMREKALSTMSAPTHRLWEVKLGTWDADVTKDGKQIRAGSPISWSPAEVTSGEMNVTAADGTARRVTWADAAQNPGWCKLDWVVADPTRGQLANASNVLDPTWQSPDGKVVPLDGFLDPYFQEVYLDTEARPLFDKLVNEMSADVVDEYVSQLEHEIWKYSVKDPNWGKVARRLYNVFRLTGRYAEAAYIRELFDEPTTALYQLSALIRTLHEAASEGTPFEGELLVAQTDQLIMSAIGALDGPEEAQMVGGLLRLRDNVSGRKSGDRAGDVESLQSETMDAVNDYFRRRLTALPEIADYLDRIAAEGEAK
ncbi:MAG TPA: hypothetical protein VEX62_13620 [Candidatus Limnocylindrales bacterium]|nr:hypothetical protein [Candidatus Limnocylindrales bacterium]